MNKIPKNIYQTFSSYNLPDEIIEIINNNKKTCPGYNFFFYNDSECETFIKENFKEQVYKAYISINDCYGAMKADFWRYCILFKKGGIYLDIKSSILPSFNDLIQPDDLCLLDQLRCFETWRINAPTHEQWVLIFAPRHPYLLEIIKTMVSNILCKYSPSIPGISVLNSKQKILHVTGPDMFTKNITKYLRNNKPLHRIIDNDQYFLYKKSDSYLKIYSMNNKLHYSEYSESLYK